MKPQPGQIVRVLEIIVSGEPYESIPAVEVFTHNGPALGFLFAPANGTEGGLVFKPAPDEYQHLAGEPLPTAEQPQEVPAQPGGALTTATVPQPGRGAPAANDGEIDQNDPRGIRSGRDRRP